MLTSLNILALDDHQFFLKGIAECFNSVPFIQKVDTCCNYRGLKTKLAESIPDILFLDLNMPDQDGFAICEEIRRNYHGVFIIVLTQYESSKYVERARQSGAGAYFLKNTEPEVLTDFLKDYMHGRIRGFHVHIPPVAYAQHGFCRKEDFIMIDQLSRRELEVLKLLASGAEHEDIEKSLCISYDTFKTHRTNILQKLKLKNVACLVKFAIQYRLIDSEEMQPRHASEN
jgi:DNA-binding NarL/FixJ family response regulator